MTDNFRLLCAMCSFGALLVIAGFFLTKIPVWIQIILLLSGIIICIITLVGVIKFYRKNIKNNA